MKHASLFLFLATKSVFCQQLIWFDTLDYNVAVSVGHIHAHSSEKVVMFGGQGIPDRYNPVGSLYVTTLDASGKRIWYRDDIIGGGSKSNLHCDLEGNIYFAQRFFDTTSSICGTSINPGTYMIRLSKEGEYEWHSLMPVFPSSNYSVVSDKKGVIELRSFIGNGKTALHQYDVQGNLINSNHDEQSRFCIYDSQGNAYKIINGLLTKFNPDGHPLWIYMVGQEDLDYARIIIDPYGCSYILADYVTKINTSGVVEWIKPIGGTIGDCDGANLYTAGQYYENGVRMGGVVHKTNARTGEIVWSKYIPHSKYFKVMALSAAGGNVFVGAHFDNSTIHAYLLMLKDQSYQPVTPVTTGIEDGHAIGQFGIFPNPGSDVFTVTVPENCTEFSYKVFDASGKVVREVTGCSGHQEINLKQNAKGIYQVRIQPVNGPAQVKKIIVE